MGNSKITPRVFSGIPEEQDRSNVRHRIRTYPDRAEVLDAACGKRAWQRVVRTGDAREAAGGGAAHGFPREIELAGRGDLFYA